MAAPTIQLTVHQRTPSQPYHPVLVTCGMARVYMARNTDWTQSPANTNEYYYNGTLSALSSNTMFRHRVERSQRKGREGTVGALLTEGFGVGNNDSLAADTLYVRADDSLAPGDYEYAIIWNETEPNDGRKISDSIVEWWMDLTDGPTASAVAAWDSRARYAVNPETGVADIDMAGSLPTATTQSPIRGWHYHAALPTGTLKLMCRVTNADGEATTTSTTITVAADTRTLREVRATGGTHTTIASAVSGASTDTRILIEDGHAETITTAINIPAGGVLLDFEGTATLSSGGVRLFDGISAYCTFLAQPASVSLNPTATIGLYAIRVNTGSHYLFTGLYLRSSGTNRFDGITEHSYFNDTTFRLGRTLMNCKVDTATEYVFGQSTVNRHYQGDVQLIGNDWRGVSGNSSQDESTIRTLGRDMSWSVAYNQISETAKDGLRLQQMDVARVYGNRFINGVIRLGNSVNAYDRADNVTIEGNFIERSLVTSGIGSIDGRGAYDCTIRNNVFITSSGTTISDICVNYSTTSDINTVYTNYQGQVRVDTKHNTFEILAGALDANVTAGGAATDCEIENNLVVAHASYAGSYLGSTATLINNQTGIGTLNSDYVSSLTPSVVTVPPGIHRDYYGRAFDSGDTGWAGAVMSEFPEPMPTVVGRSRNRSRIR